MIIDVETTSTLASRSIITLFDSGALNKLGLQIVDGVVKIFSAGFTSGQGSIIINDGNLHRLSLTVDRITGLCTLLVDGVFDYSVTHSSVSNIKSDYFIAVGSEIENTSAPPIRNIDAKLANVKIEGGGGLVFDMPIDGNYTPTNNTVIDRASGNNGTFVSVATGDSKLFTQRSDGNYYGNNVAPIGEFNKTDSGPLLVPLDNQLEPNEIYDVEFNYDNNTSSPAVRLGSATSGGLLGNLSSNVTNTVFSGQAAAASNNGLYVIGTASLCTLRDIRIERFLEVAY